MHRLRAGVARRDITPALGSYLMGYPDVQNQRTAESVRDPLNATALVVESRGRRAALLSLDLCLFEDEHVRAIRAGVAARTPIAEMDIVVAATHTHSAPRTQEVWGWCEVDRPYVDEVMLPGAIEAIVEAAERLAPARVGFARTDSDVGIARRTLNPEHEVVLGQQPWGVTDPTMTVLRIDTVMGPLANLVHYGAHPTVLGKSSRAVSRDWPGLIVDRMEQLTGATTLFFNGGMGDVAPRTNAMRAVGDGSEAALWEAGAAAGMDAMRAWRSIKELRDVELHTRHGTIDWPRRPLAPLDEARRNLARWEPEKDHPGAPMAEYKHWRAVVAAHEQPGGDRGSTYEQTLVALGPVAFVPFPGEPFAELSLRTRDLSPFAHTLCLAASCGNRGYLYTKEATARGGYELWVNRAYGAYLPTDDLGDVLVQRNAELLHELHRDACPPMDDDSSEETVG